MNAAALPAFAQRSAGADLEPPLQEVETRLADLSTALRDGDPHALESAAQGLQAALGAAVGQFRQAARAGGVPLPMKQRLAQAGAQVAVQRESLARATAALDRAIDVLLPSSPISAATYGNGPGLHRASARAAVIA
jgi:hypothetical protein